MKSKAKLFLTVACVVILSDALASVASRSLSFNYTNLVWVSLCLYLGSGYIGCKYHDFPTGVLAGTVAGLSDSTIGWALSSAIGSNIMSDQPRHTPLSILIVIIIVTTTGTFFGLLGALLGRLVRSK